MNEIQIARLIFNLLLDSAKKMGVEREAFQHIIEKYDDGKYHRFMPIEAMNEFLEKLLTYKSEEEIIKVIGYDGVHSDRLSSFRAVIFSFVTHKSLYKLQSSFVLPYFFRGLKLNVEIDKDILTLRQYSVNGAPLHPLLFKIYLEVYQEFPVIIGRSRATLIDFEITDNYLLMRIKPSGKNLIRSFLRYFKSRINHFRARGWYYDYINKLRSEAEAKNQELERVNKLLDKSLKEKSILVRTLGHDINNSIYVTNLAYKKILKISDNEQVQSLANKIGKHITIIENITTQSLENEIGDDDFASGFSKERASRLIHELVENYQDQIEKKKLLIEIATQTTDDLFYTNKSVFLYNVLSNYFYNAIKYSNPDQKITLKVENSENELVFSIIDEGKGMDLEDLKQKRGTQGELGHGQGMKIAESLIHKMEGKVKIESSLGKGTSIKIIIPRRASFIR